MPAMPVTDTRRLRPSRNTPLEQVDELAKLAIAPDERARVGARCRPGHGLSAALRRSNASSRLSFDP